MIYLAYFIIYVTLFWVIFPATGYSLHGYLGSVKISHVALSVLLTIVGSVYSVYWAIETIIKDLL